MKYVNKQKKCFFKENAIKKIDYKNIPLLLKFVDYFGKIKKSYYTWTSRGMQKQLASSVKKARQMALICYVR